MKSSYLYRTCLFCSLQVTPSLWLLLCLVLLLSGKTFWSCVTYFPIMSVFSICSCHGLIWKGFFSLQSSLATLMKQSTLRVHTSSMFSYFRIFPLSLFPYCQHGGLFYEPLLTKPCLIAAVQTVKPRCTRDFNTQHEHNVSQGSTIAFCLIPCHYFLVQNDQ